MNNLKVGDRVVITCKPDGGPDVGTICKVLAINNDTLKIETNGTGYGWFIKMLANVMRYESDLELDVGL